MAGLRTRLNYIFSGLWLFWNGVWAVRIYAPGDIRAEGPGSLESIAPIALLLWLLGFAGGLFGLWLLTRRIAVDELGETARRLYRLPLAASILFAGLWLAITIALYLSLRLQSIGALSAGTILIGGVAGAIALPMLIYAIVATLVGPIVAEISAQASNAGVPVRGHSLSLRAKVVLLATLFPVAYTIWAGGLAYYSGVQEMIFEIEYSGSQAHEFLLHDTAIDDEFVSTMRLKLKRARFSFRRDFFLFESGGAQPVVRTGPGLFRFNEHAGEFAERFQKTLLGAEGSRSFYDPELERLILCTPGSGFRICSVRGIGEELDRLGSLQISIAAFALTGLILAGLIAYFFGAVIARSIYRLSSMIARVEGGRLDERAGAESLDEVGRLGLLLSAFFARLSSKLDDVGNAARKLDQSSGVQSANAAGFSNLAQDQASATEEAQAAMEAMSAAVEEVAGEVHEQGESIQKVREILRGDLMNAMTELNQGARDVLEYSSQQLRGAESAEGVALQAVAGIERVVDSSNDIMRVIAAINEISDRTALLSLNASIEAARAGEAGRGFAVVAEEVSRLAERSSLATREVEEILNASRTNVDEGAERVRLLVKAVEELRGEAGRVNEAGRFMERLAGEQLRLNERIQVAIGEIEERAAKVAGAERSQSASAAEMMNTIASISESAQSISLNAQKMVEVIDGTVAQASALTAAVREFKVDS